MRFPKPCLTCGVLTTGGSRCPTHQGELDRMKELKATAQKKERKSFYYNADYRRRAKQVRETALICHICHDGPRYYDPWQADHLIPGDIHSPLAPAHRSCNAKRGSKAL